jgi:hypothetical protein
MTMSLTFWDSLVVKEIFKARIRPLPRIAVFQAQRGQVDIEIGAPWVHAPSSHCLGQGQLPRDVWKAYSSDVEIFLS